MFTKPGPSNLIIFIVVSQGKRRYLTVASPTRKKVTLFEKFSRLVRGNLFVPDPRRGWNKYALRKAIELIKAENIESVITSGPPHSTHLIGQKSKIKPESDGLPILGTPGPTSIITKSSTTRCLRECMTSLWRKWSCLAPIKLSR